MFYIELQEKNLFLIKWLSTILPSDFHPNLWFVACKLLFISKEIYQQGIIRMAPKHKQMKTLRMPGNHLSKYIILQKRGKQGQLKGDEQKLVTVQMKSRGYLQDLEWVAHNVLKFLLNIIEIKNCISLSLFVWPSTYLFPCFYQLDVKFYSR